jgi:hypothetical protein
MQTFSITEVKKLSAEIYLTSEEIQAMMKRSGGSSNNNTAQVTDQRLENGIRPNVSNFWHISLPSLRPLDNISGERSHN